MLYLTMSARSIPISLFRFSGTLLHPKINCRFCSTSDGDGSAKSDNTKLFDFLNKQKKLQTKPSKPVQLKAKPVKKNIPETSSSSSSSSSSDEEIDEDLALATKKVAASTTIKIKNADDKERVKKIVETDLTRKLKALHLETKTSRQKSEVQDVGNDDVLMAMKVMKEPESKEKLHPAEKTFKELTPQQRDFLMERKRKRAEMKNKQLIEAYVPMNLFEAEKPMGIFQDVVSDEQKIESSTILKTWQAISNREMQILKTQPPRNLIEDMASMTDKGILWHFPIDNEQGINQDEMDSFIEHVFLERHIEEWCPQTGPLRDFMEAVCTTLSKNAFMTAEKKLEYIDWFRDYFNRPHQKDILTISGALDG